MLLHPRSLSGEARYLAGLACEDQWSAPARNLMCCIWMSRGTRSSLHWIVRDRAFSGDSAHGCRGDTGVVATQKKGHPVMLDGPSTQVMFRHYAGRGPPHRPVPLRIPIVAG